MKTADRDVGRYKMKTADRDVGRYKMKTADRDVGRYKMKTADRDVGRYKSIEIVIELNLRFDDYFPNSADIASSHRDLIAPTC
jgi:hypothetical protein